LVRVLMLYGLRKVAISILRRRGGTEKNGGLKFITGQEK
jgi:hypothetical protein